MTKNQLKPHQTMRPIYIMTWIRNQQCCYDKHIHCQCHLSNGLLRVHYVISIACMSLMGSNGGSRKTQVWVRGAFYDQILLLQKCIFSMKNVTMSIVFLWTDDNLSYHQRRIA